MRWAWSATFGAGVALAGCYLPIGDPSNQVQLSWQLEQDGQPVGCDLVGAIAVKVHTEDAADGYAFDDVFPCDDGVGRIDGLVHGDYVVRVSATDANEAPLVTVETWTRVPRGGVAQLGQIELPIPP